MNADQRIHRERFVGAYGRWQTDRKGADLEILLDALVALDLMEVKLRFQEDGAHKEYCPKPDRHALIVQLFGKEAR